MTALIFVEVYMEIRARPKGLIFIQKIRTKERSEVYENGTG